MTAFLDTSVLVPVFYGDHEHHAPSFDLFLTLDKSSGGCGAHSLAEIFSTLTAMPGKYRVTADQAALFIRDVINRLEVIALTADEYAAALETWSALGITGGTVYDAMLASCALKADAETIYSWNLRHYRQLGPDVQRRLRSPA